MGPKKQSEMEKKLAKKLRDKLRYEKIKNDPIKLMENKLKSQEKYKKRKAKGTVKTVDEMSNREKRAKRKQWRENTKHFREKKKEKDQSKDKDQRTSITPINITHQMISGRKRKARARSHVNRQTEALKKKLLHLENANQKLKRKNDCLRKRIERQEGRSSTSKSPRSTIKKMLNVKKIKGTVQRKLFFGEVLGKQLDENFKQLKSRKAKQSFASFLLGDAKWLRKYGLLTSCRFISPKILKTTARNRHKNDKKNRVAKTISDQVRADVVAFFEEDENTRVCPGKKDCITRNGVKKQKRMLTADLKDLHIKFLRTAPYKICYSFFCKMKPFWVLFPNVIKRDTCQCQTHENFNLLIRGIYNAKVISSPDVNAIKKQLCCDPPKEECMFRTCKTCKSKNILFSSFEGAASVNFQQWMTKKVSYIDPKSKLQKTTNRTMKTTVTTTLLKLVRQVDESYVRFLCHEGKIMHQYAAVKRLKESLKVDEVLIHCDFSENFSTKYSEEIQSIHFGGNRQSLSLHTVVVYHRQTEQSCLSVTNFCTISENLDHGPGAIWAHFQPIFKFILTSIPKITSINFLSDGPSSQYRNKTIFHFIQCRLSEVFPHLTRATWNYHESGHGKGAPDGIGATVKRTADRVVAQGRDITDVTTLVQEITNKIKKVNILVLPSSAITEISQSIPLGLQAFKGTMSTHQVVWLKGENSLHMNSLSCFTCSYNCSSYHIGSHISLKKIAYYRTKITKKAKKTRKKKKKKNPIKKKNKRNPTLSLKLSKVPYENENDDLMEINTPKVIDGTRNLETPPEIVDDSLFDANTAVGSPMIKIIVKGLCYQCGNSVSTKKPGRLCDVCQTSVYHDECIAPPLTILRCEDMEIFCCKKCDDLSLELNKLCT